MITPTTKSIRRNWEKQIRDWLKGKVEAHVANYAQWQLKDMVFAGQAVLTLDFAKRTGIIQFTRIKRMLGQAHRIHRVVVAELE